MARTPEDNRNYNRYAALATDSNEETMRSELNKVISKPVPVKSFNIRRTYIQQGLHHGAPFFEELMSGYHHCGYYEASTIWKRFPAKKK